MKPLEIVRLHRSEDVAERPGEWRCGLTRARELMLDAPAAQAIDRLARLSAEIDLPNPHGALDLEGVTFAFRPAEDGRQRFAGVLVRTPAGRVLRHAPVEEGVPGTAVVWFLPAPLEALIASAVRPEERPVLEGTPRAVQAEAPPEVVPARPAGKTVTDLIALGQEAAFSAYAAVRSGRDEFSSMSLPKLRELLGERAETAEGAARDLCPDLPDATLARVLRWVARGLPGAQAARITQVHDELAQAHRSPPGKAPSEG
ncbi:hypothetical protein [Deinococcus budaensis]|uniref:Uncharacterized protein n=1 Tax=Deinococcus budaensis TaxID=1665626 RepID=A0A7W8GER0_9DEIO|nr:hypothetical protein [Deinococcus budaensis]MBB5234266.1 hypothetical protein [Deinococcus budaensis]